MKIAVFLGAPGSGKGTQAKKLAEKYGYLHLSTGDMLRAAIQAGNDLGKKAKGFIERGELVPDSLMIELIETTLQEKKSVPQVLLDGFPRTVPQAEALDAKTATSVWKAIYFIIPEDKLVTRLTGRRTCKNCGEPFHVAFIPPKKEGSCDKCGGPLVQRPDDSDAVVVKRLEVYKTQTSPLLGYYANKKNLLELNADRPLDSVQTDLVKLLQ